MLRLRRLALTGEDERAGVLGEGSVRLEIAGTGNDRDRIADGFDPRVRCAGVGSGVQRFRGICIRTRRAGGLHRRITSASRGSG